MEQHQGKQNNTCPGRMLKKDFGENRSVDQRFFGAAKLRGYPVFNTKSKRFGKAPGQKIHRVKQGNNSDHNQQ